MIEVVFQILVVCHYITTSCRSRNIGTYSISISQSCFFWIPVSITLVSVTGSSRHFCNSYLDTNVYRVVYIRFGLILSIESQSAILVISNNLIHLSLSCSPSQDGVCTCCIVFLILSETSIYIVNYFFKTTLAVWDISFSSSETESSGKFIFCKIQFFQYLTRHICPCYTLFKAIAQIWLLRFTLINNNSLKSDLSWNFQSDITG